MATLIFLATVITILILFIGLIINIIKHERVFSTIRMIVIVIAAYFFLWVIFYYKSVERAVPLGTDICFDDWCATITKIEKPKTLGKENHLLIPHGQFIILHIKVSNQAKGIAQKPSEPRVNIIDEQGRSWQFSKEGQQALEESTGRQIPIDEKLELHQSLETQLVFEIPKDAKNLMIIIDEGPFITKLLLNEDKKIFRIE
ncbi:MAG: DUF4352 domain-containing protein [Bacteroidota bacterium]|nr:DUF4352 domain-containing protein [Bacteroidota bacterium]